MITAVELFLHASKATGLFALSRLASRRRLRILCYHGAWIGGPPHYGDCLFMDPDRFARRMQFLKGLGYPILGLGEAVERLAKGTLPVCAVAITIDDAWYGTHARMLPVLKQHGIPATLYVTTYYAVARRPVLNVLVGYMIGQAQRMPDLAAVFPDAPALDGTTESGAMDRPVLTQRVSTWIDSLPDLDTRWGAVQRLARHLGFDLDAVVADRRFDLMNESEISQAAADGFDIQLHTHTHRMSDFDPGKLAQEIQTNRDALARMTGKAAGTFEHFCYPSGVYHEKIFGTLRDMGLRTATTTDFGLNGAGVNLFALKRILDCNSMSDIELEARLSGFWGLLRRVKQWLSRDPQAARA